MSDKIFSGDTSIKFWEAVGFCSGTPQWDTLYSYGCKAQEMESLLDAARAENDRLKAELATEREKVAGLINDPVIAGMSARIRDLARQENRIDWYDKAKGGKA